MPRLAVWARRATTRGLVFIRSHRVVVKNAWRVVAQFRRGGCPGCIGHLARGIFAEQRTFTKVVLTGPSPQEPFDKLRTNGFKLNGADSISAARTGLCRHP